MTGGRDEWTPRPLARLAPWLLLGILVALGLRAVAPPRALPLDAPAPEFSASRARVPLAAIARVPHPIGSPAIAEVRRFLVAQLERLGLEPTLQRFPARSWFGSDEPVEGVNIVARIPGTRNEPAVLLMAHYDTVPTTPGANDDSAGVAALLEAARALLEGPPVAHDVILLFTDGEEPAPRFGSRAFLAGHPAARDVGFVVNLEAVGGSGPSMLVETSGPEPGIVAAWSAAVPHPVAFSFVGEVVKRLGDVGTDFDAFRRAGVPGVHLAWTRNSPIYHTPADRIDAVSPCSLQHHGEQIVALARHLDPRQFEGEAQGGAVYFTLGPWFVRYPPAWSVLAALLAALLLALAARRTRLPPGRLTVATGRTLVAVLAATVGTTAVWVGVAALHATPSMPVAYATLLALVALAAWVEHLLTIGMRPEVRASAAVVLWIALALPVTLAAPGAGYVFVGPALVAAVSLNTPAGGRWAWLRFALVALAAVVLAVPVVDFFFQMGQPRPGNLDSSMPAAAAVALLHVALVVALLRAVWPRGHPRHGATRDDP